MTDDPNDYVDDEGRDLMRRSLKQLLPVLDVLEGDDLREAAQACLALLDSPAPLERRAIAPLMRAVSERASQMFRRLAAETTGEIHRQMMQGAELAANDAALMDEVVNRYKVKPD